MQVALRPLGPANEAINPNRQTYARCAERSTPLAGRVSSGRRATADSNPPDWTEDEGPVSNLVDSARAACGGPTSNSAVTAFPLGQTARATGIMHPGF